MVARPVLKANMRMDSNALLVDFNVANARKLNVSYAKEIITFMERFV